MSLLGIPELFILALVVSFALVAVGIVIGARWERTDETRLARQARARAIKAVVEHRWVNKEAAIVIVNDFRSMGLSYPEIEEAAKYRWSEEVTPGEPQIRTLLRGGGLT